MTSLKYIFSKAQYKLSRERSVKMLKWLNPVRSSGAWGGQLFLQEPQQYTETFLLSPGETTRIPGPRCSYAACAWIIHQHSLPVRLVHTSPWETGTQRAGELLCSTAPDLVSLNYSAVSKAWPGDISTKHKWLRFNFRTVPLKIQTGLRLPHCYTRPLGLSVAPSKKQPACHHDRTKTLQAGWIMTRMLIENMVLQHSSDSKNKKTLNPVILGVL